MNILKYVFLIIIALHHSSTFAQLKKIVHPNLFSEADIFIHEESNIRYSDLITLKFNNKVIDLMPGVSAVELIDINNQEVKVYFNNLLEKYGGFDIVKLIPFAVWGDTLTINKRTREEIRVPDWSQVVQLKFDKLVPIDSIITELQSLSIIEYAEEPFSAYSTIEPNDEKYVNGNNWAFTAINAQDAWEIKKGRSSIAIAIIDKFGNMKNVELHEDLIGKVDYQYHLYGNQPREHGICIAGVVGANTDNEIGVASLGWNLKLQLYDKCQVVPAIMESRKYGVDVINFSWVRNIDMHSLRAAIKTVLAEGIVCVAAAGNNEEISYPDAVYPAAYNFGELGQVIAVSATEMVGNEERFIDGWNYSPDNNPLVNPTGSFIDVAAPGMDIEVLSDTSTLGYSLACGTSLSSAFVSAMVGLMFSIDRNLTPNEVYNIIINTSDKIGQYPYDENGWNQYLGYGRINVYEALKYLTSNQINPSINISPTTFQKYEGNPVFSGTSNEWDSYLLFRSSIVYHEDKYHMYYTAKNRTLGGLDPWELNMGYASSIDAINWEKDPYNPILEYDDSNFEKRGFYEPIVLITDTIWHMWYTILSPPNTVNGFDYPIGYASSSDGKVWKRLKTRLDFRKGEAGWDNFSLLPLDVIFNGEQFLMYYVAQDFNINNPNAQFSIGVAESYDGITWEKQKPDEPILVGGPPGSLQDNLYNLDVVFDASNVENPYQMWYIGFNEFGDKDHIFYATSVDGKAWEKHLWPLFSSAGDSWAQKYYEDIEVVKVDNKYQMWINGLNEDAQSGSALGYMFEQENIITVDVDEKLVLPTKFALTQNYPNPFNPRTKIKYSISERSKTTLKIFDILSRKISTLVNKQQPQGNYTVEFDGENLSSGIYFYRLQAGDFVETKKMILLK